MGTTKATMFGGLLAVAVVAGMGVDPANAGVYVSVNVGGGSWGCYSAPAPRVVTYSSSYYSPCYTPAYRQVHYRAPSYYSPCAPSMSPWSVV